MLLGKGQKFVIACGLLKLRFTHFNRITNQITLHNLSSYRCLPAKYSSYWLLNSVFFASTGSYRCRSYCRAASFPLRAWARRVAYLAVRSFSRHSLRCLPWCRYGMYPPASLFQSYSRGMCLGVDLERLLPMFLGWVCECVCLLWIYVWNK